MTLDEKRKALYDWIKNLDEEALDQLIIEYLDVGELNLKN